MNDKTPLRGLTNIGPTIAKRLEAVGVRTVGDLKHVGPAQTYRLVKAHHAGTTVPVCYYLYSLQGALDGVHWDALPIATKDKLLKEAGVYPGETKNKGMIYGNKNQKLARENEQWQKARSEKAGQKLC
jgi:DNA transformation protein